MSKINVPFVFRVCASPVCSSKIWADGFKYKSGKFCDKYCEEDYNLSTLNKNQAGKRGMTPAQKAQVARMHDARHGTGRPGRNADIMSDDYKFEFNPKTT